jgi:hypothetical protein
LFCSLGRLFFLCQANILIWFRYYEDDFQSKPTHLKDCKKEMNSWQRKKKRKIVGNECVSNAIDRKHKMDHAKHINICTTRNQESLTFHPFYVCTQDSFSPLNHSTIDSMTRLQRPKVCSCTTEKSQTADCASNRQSGINNNKKLVGGLEKELRWSTWSTIDNQPTMQRKKKRRRGRWIGPYNCTVRNWGTYNLFWVSFWDIIFALHCNWSVNAEWDDSAMFLSLLLASLTASLFPLNWGGGGTTLVSFSGCAGGFIDVCVEVVWMTIQQNFAWLTCSKG